MQHELKGSPIIRLLKGYTLNTGKKLPVGQVFRRERKEAEQMIILGIAEVYQGPFPPKKMKINLKDLTIKWQQLES